MLKNDHMHTAVHAMPRAALPCPRVHGHVRSIYPRPPRDGTAIADFAVILPLDVCKHRLVLGSIKLVELDVRRADELVVGIVRTWLPVRGVIFPFAQFIFVEVCPVLQDIEHLLCSDGVGNFGNRVAVYTRAGVRRWFAMVQVMLNGATPCKQPWTLNPDSFYATTIALRHDASPESAFQVTASN